MKVAYFNLNAGASGDMIIGALLDAGLPYSFIKKIINKLRLKKIHIDIKRVERNHLPGIQVRFEGGKKLSPQEMRLRIKNSTLSKEVKARALIILGLLIEAEAHAHGIDAQKVHFHQLSEPDTIIDITVAAAAIEALGIQKIVASPINGGAIAPAAAYILKQSKAKIIVDIDSSCIERITPTGAAILAGCGAEYRSLSDMTVSSSGYGAGERIMKTKSNLLHVLIGHVPDLSIDEQEDVVLMETNIDDMDPRVYPYVIEKLFRGGALDAWLTPIHMKKGRPAVTVSVLSDHEKVDVLRSVLLYETTTLGVRYTSMKRWCIPRWKKGYVKFGMFKGKTKRNIELKDAVSIARNKKIPLYEVLKKW